jgi:2-desacetyl-2-hydroxyethyl bacteriochlorophyllide A dehydrogenase
MKALVYVAPSIMELQDVERPACAAGQLLVRVEYSGICGSELSGFLGQNSLRRPPLIFGHELSGLVAESGDPSYAVGDRVTVNPLVTCGQCERCLAGRQQLCAFRLLLGASLPGSNAEYVVVPATSAERVPEGLHLRDAALAEPVACAIHAVEVSGIGPAQSALVVGAGPIGLFLVQVLRAHGVAQVLVTDRNPERLDAAATAGAIPVPAGPEELLEAVRDATGDGVAVAFDAAGTEQTRRSCVAATAAGGAVMLVGLHTDQTTLPLNTAIRGEITIQGVFAYTPVAFRTALRWLAEGRIGLGEAVVESSLEDGPSWYQRLVDGDPVAKVLLRPVTEVKEDVPCA